ncbi:MAG: murein biosynthesis integral membrane protein MurJ [Gammaproteobacteria bacterium]|nr:murein biosynthesis integral membrane protein MurJ [Gammaproteobacteria bacterium]
MSSLLKSTLSVGSMTMLSRMLGLARDIIIARFFSASDAADAFFIAFKIPNFLRRLFAEGAFSLAFVPVLTEYRNQLSEAETRELINRVAGTLGLILLLLAAIGVFASPLLISIFAAGFIDQPEKFNLTADMLRITFPYILLISMTAMSAGILNTWKRFLVPAFTPVLLNLSMIACAMWLSPRLDVPITALAWAVLIAGILQLLFQLPFLYREGLLPTPVWGWRHAGVQKILKLMVPALFGSSVAQVNLLFDTFIASFLVSGSVSWLYYSDRLLEFPLGVFGIALATVVLPNLSEAHYKKGATHFSQTLRWAIQLSLLVAVPATIGLFLLAQPILSTLFEYGVFAVTDTHMAAFSLMAYCLGLPAMVLIKILASGFYARQNTRTPVRIGIQAMCLNMLLNVVFVVTMIRTDFMAPHVGLALATTGSAYFNAAMLAFTLEKEHILEGFNTFGLILLKVLLACCAMSVVILLLEPDAEFWSSWAWNQRILELSFVILPAILCYGIMLWVMGFRRQHFSPEAHS